MMRVIQQEWKFFIVIVLVIVIVAAFYYEYKQYNANRQAEKLTQPNITINTAGEKSKPGEAQVVYLQGQETHTKEIVYVPKAIDAKTGEIEKTDVQFENKNNKIYVKVNDKEYEIPADVKENTRFEKGKLIITEETEMRVNITAPKPSFNLGLGWSKEGPAAQLNGPLFKNVSWWVYGDKSNVAGGVQFPIMK